jgi:hypothetical protein
MWRKGKSFFENYLQLQKFEVILSNYSFLILKIIFYIYIFKTNREETFNGTFNFIPIPYQNFLSFQKHFFVENVRCSFCTWKNIVLKFNIVTMSSILAVLFQNSFVWRSLFCLLVLFSNFRNVTEKWNIVSH